MKPPRVVLSLINWWIAVQEISLNIGQILRKPRRILAGKRRVIYTQWLRMLGAGSRIIRKVTQKLKQSLVTVAIQTPIMIDGRLLMRIAELKPKLGAVAREDFP